jgi:hypothetical protein
MVYQVGEVEVELDPDKGIWCEFCSKEPERIMLITVSRELRTSLMPHENICIPCATNLVTALRKSLMAALLLPN